MFVFLFVISTLYILGLGITFSRAVLTHDETNSAALRNLALLFLLGLVLNYLLILLTPSLKISYEIGAVIAVIAVAIHAKVLAKLLRQAFANRAVNIFLAVLSALFLARAFTTPISEWDARSIWFFHAKFFYYNQSAFNPTGWTEPAYAFSHRDYPAFIPALASQLATAASFWNEYLPKISIWLAAAPVFLILASYFEKRWSFAFLILFQLVIIAKFLDNGLMDGLLALYTSLALLLFAQPSKNKALILTLLSLTLGLKNEGQLLCLSFALMAAIIYRHELKNLASLNSLKAAALLIFLAAPHVIWSTHVKHLGLVNDIQPGLGSLPFIRDRIMHPYAVWRIFSFMFLRSQLIYWPLLFWFLTKAAHKFNAARPPIAPFIIFFAIYASGLFLIYLATPHDLEWHLVTSTYRTTLPLVLAMTGAAYLRLRVIDQP